MRVFPVCSIIYALFALLCLSACTDRSAMTIDYLSKNILASYQFDVTNASNGTDITPVSNAVPFEVECSKSVIGIEVMDQATQTWQAVSDIDGSSRLNCAEEKAASFTLPMTAVGPTVGPTSPGDQRKNIQVRLTVKNVRGENNQYLKNYNAVFAAPTVNVQTAANIGGTSGGGAAGSTYTVSGSCSLDGGSIEVSAPFAATVNSTCSHGAYSVDMTLGTVTEGSPKISVKHTPTAPIYAFSQAEKTILIDRTAPTVRINSPTNGSTFTQSNTSGGGIAVSGVCESGLSVSLSVGGGSSQVACSNGSFSTTVMATQGSMSFSVSQTDALGNTGTGSTITVTVDTVAPTAASGIGILSASGGTDATADQTLTDINPRIQFVNTDASAATFDVKIATTSGTTLCSVVDISGGAAGTFIGTPTGCNLTNGTTYNMVVRSKDSLGNYSEATQSFLVNYSVPFISSMTVTNATDGAVLSLANLNFEINFDITFNRPVTISSGTAVILLNTTGAIGRSVGLYSTLNSNKTYRFKYVLGSNEYAPKLAFLSNVINNAVFVDAANGMTANLTIPTASFTQSVKVDTVAPGAPTGVSLGSVLPYYTETPVINFTLPADVETLSSYIVLKTSGGTTITWSSGLGSGAKMTSLNLDKGTAYTVEVYSQDLAGNRSTAVTTSFTSFACPTNFLYVYHATYAPTPFCIAQTEAKGSATSVNFNTATGNGNPLEASYNVAAGITANNGCKSLSPQAKYDLPTNAEWNAVANILAERGENWLTGAVGASGTTINYIPPGITGGGPTASVYPVDESNLCHPSNCSTYPYTRRGLRLPPIGSATQTIWDFSGNMYELTKDPDTTGYGTLNSLIIGASGILKTKYGPAANITCTGSSASANPYCGLGSINFLCGEMSNYASCSGTLTTPFFAYVLRGGGASSSNISPTVDNIYENAGIFSAYRMADAISTPSRQGFRCVYHP